MYSYGLPLNRVAISGSNGPRASLFAPATKEIFGLGAAVPTTVHRRLGGRSLGLSLEDGRRMYLEAKDAIARFDQLATTASRIAYKPARDAIISDYGLLEPDNQDKALNQRNDLLQYVQEVEANPAAPNYYVFIQATTRPRNRLQAVKNADASLERDVNEAVRTYDVLPEPQVIIKEIQVPGAAPAGGTNVLPYVVVGGVAVAALAALGVFG